MKPHFLLLLLTLVGAQAEPWKRHTIDEFDTDAGKKGADGVRLGDVNGDGLLDITTGWEEGGAVRICLNPGPESATSAWPSYTVGNIKGVEDAVFADLDADGSLDVVSCAEGRVNNVFVHWAPSENSEAGNWPTKAIPATARRRWMFALPLDVNEDGKLDLVVGSKKGNAIVGWLEQPAKARSLKTWLLHSMTPAGWIMSLRSLDVDGDGDQDIVFSDRYEQDCGVFWIENPGTESPKLRETWDRHLIGGAGRQVMFLTVGELNGDEGSEIVCATLEGDLLIFEQTEKGWQESTVPLPFGLTAGKGVAIADINLDGRADLVTTSEAQREKPSMVSVAWKEQTEDGTWVDHRISDERGRKFDRIEMLDLDADGDLDLITCEEVHNLGVFWYENPQN